MEVDCSWNPQPYLVSSCSLRERVEGNSTMLAQIKAAFSRATVRGNSVLVLSNILNNILSRICTGIYTGMYWVIYWDVLGNILSNVLGNILNVLSNILRCAKQYTGMY